MIKTKQKQCLKKKKRMQAQFYGHVFGNTNTISLGMLSLKPTEMA